MRKVRSTKLATGAVAVALAGVAIAGCGGSSTSTTKSTTHTTGATSTKAAAKTTASGSGKSVAFIPGATGVAFYNTMASGIKAEAQSLGMSFSTQGSPDFTPSGQTPIVEAVCTKKPTLLLIAPTDPVAMRPAIQQCMNEGVKVVLVDTALTDESGIISAITSDNIQGGEAAGKYMASLMHGKGEIATMSLSPTASTQVERVKGVENALKAYPNMKIVANEFTQQAPSSSDTTASSLLSAHPTLAGFFGASEPNAQGVAQAMKSTGKKLINVGYDGAPPEITLLKSGAITALVLQQPALEGKLGVEYGFDAITGKTSQIKKQVQLPNVLVTTAQARSGVDSKYYYTGTA